MKIQVRKGVFETNSSSMHSVVVTSDEEIYSEKEFRKDFWIHGDWEIRFYDGDELNFGRYPFRLLTTFKDKLQIVIAHILGGHASPDPHEVDKFISDLKELLTKYYPEIGKSFKGITFPDKPWSDEDEEGYYYGDIDHDSADLLSNTLRFENISWQDFLIHKKYIYIVDGDEYCEWKKCKESGIINTSIIVKEYES